jgi:hypothetical protein
MKNELKEKLGYWAESLVLLGGALIGFAMCCGGLYMLYVIINAVIG